MNDPEEIVVTASDGFSIGPLHLKWLAADAIFVTLLVLLFGALHRSTLALPYHGEDLPVAQSARLLLRNHLKPVVSDFRDGILVQEVYATGWLTLGKEYGWWPHIVVLAFAFLALTSAYKLTGAGWPSIEGLLVASLVAIDPLFLKVSQGISVAAPAVGLASAALYYFVEDKPKRFAIMGSLTVLCYTPAVVFIFCLSGLALFRHLFQFEDDTSQFSYLGVLRGRNWGVVVCFLIPCIVFAILILLQPWWQGYSMFDWIAKRTAGFQNHGFSNSFREVFLRHGHLPFTVVAVCGVLVCWGLLLWVRLVDFWDRRQAAQLSLVIASSSQLMLSSALLLDLAAFAAVMALSSVIPEGRLNLLILIVPLFVLTFRYLLGVWVVVQVYYPYKWFMRYQFRRPVELAWAISIILLLAWSLIAQW